MYWRWDNQSEVQNWFSGSGDRWHIYELSQYESSQYGSSHSELPHWEGVQSTRGWFTADFSVHDDKPIECLNKIFFGQKHREPRHGEANRAGEYLRTCRPEPEVTIVKRNRKKCYLDILGEVFRTENAAVRPSGLSCIPAPVFCLLRCRKTIPVPYSSGFFNTP